MNCLNVLLVTYAFPPAGGVGVFRAASLARYLPAEGIRLDVLTTRNPSSVVMDSTLLREIPPEVTIHRTFTLDLPFGLKKWLKRMITGGTPPAPSANGNVPAAKPNYLKRAIQDILLPDPQVTWLPFLTRAARRIVRERTIDLVIVTGSPFSNFLLIQKLRREFPHLAIVADFRDEWLSTSFDFDSFQFSRSERYRKFATKAEAAAVANANAVVAVTEAAQRAIRSRYPLQPESKFKYLPNGFDATRLHRSTASSDIHRNGKIVVTYVGTVYPSCEPTVLVKALQTLPPDIRSRFTLRFIGHIEEPRYRSALLTLGDMIELRGHLPQHEALAALDDTDYVLLTLHDPLNVAVKFYDYVGAGKPILACVHPQGDTRRLLETLRAGWWADSRDVAGIRQLFLDAAARGDSLLSEFKPDTEKIAQYERKVLARRYAELLHCIAGRGNEANTQTQDERATESLMSHA
jgi:glycosyltransferase involved in cell wall biosynthesis